MSPYFVIPMTDKDNKPMVPPSYLLPTQLSDIQFYDRPEDGVYTITWIYKTNGEGQFTFSPPTISPSPPPTIALNFTGSDTTSGVIRICGSLIIADRNQYNKYKLICKKDPTSAWARKLTPYTRVSNATYNDLMWDFYNESSSKTSITLKYGETQKINMEDGISQSTELSILKGFGYGAMTLLAIVGGWAVFATATGVIEGVADAGELELLIDYPPKGA
jgi:hypothetical protein